MCCVSRHHHGSDHVHHHHWCLSLYATGVLRQSCRHLPVGKLLVCLPVCHRVCRRQLFHHGGGDEEAQEGKGHSHSIFLFLFCQENNLEWDNNFQANSLLFCLLCRTPTPSMPARLWRSTAVSTTMTWT